MRVFRIFFAYLVEIRIVARSCESESRNATTRIFVVEGDLEGCSELLAEKPESGWFGPPRNIPIKTTLGDPGIPSNLLPCDTFAPELHDSIKVGQIRILLELELFRFFFHFHFNCFCGTQSADFFHELLTDQEKSFVQVALIFLQLIDILLAIFD